MNKVIAGASNVRLDKPDFEALHGEVVTDLRRVVRQLLASEDDGAMVVSGFTVAVNPLDNTEIVVTRGIAIAGELLAAGSVDFGQVLGEGSATRLVSLSGLAAGSYGVWVRPYFVNGRAANRAVWNVSAGEERIAVPNTRALAEWNATVAAASPGDEYQRIATVAWDGSIVAGDIADVRELFFEGTGSGGANPAVVWTIPDFARGASRGADGVKTLRQWVVAVAKRLEEVGGRAWYAAPGYGENVRSASGARLLSADTTRVSEVHDVLSVNTATRVIELAVAFTSPGALGDGRAHLRFVPLAAGSAEVIDLNTSAVGIAPSGVGYDRVIEGPVVLRRTVGENPIYRPGALGHRSTFRDVTFRAAAGSGPLVQLPNATDDLVFERCTFDATAVASVTRLVDVTGSGRVRFVNCVFAMAAASVTVGVYLADEQAPDVELVGCRFTGGATGVYLAENLGGNVRIVGCVFVDIGKGIAGVATTRVVVAGCRFVAIGTHCVDLPLLIYTGVAQADGAVLSQSFISGGALEASARRVWFGTDRRDSITHDGATLRPQRDGVNVDLSSRDIMSSRDIFTRQVDLRALIPHAWGRIEVELGGAPFYSSFYQMHDGTVPLTITAVDADGNAIDGGHEVDVDYHRFRVSGLGFADAGYVVEVSVSSTSNRDEFDYNPNPGVDLYAMDSLVVLVTDRAADSFVLVPQRIDRQQGVFPVGYGPVRPETYTIQWAIRRV